MSFELKDSGQFKVNEILIVTKAGTIDITAIYDELNIYDSLLLPVMSGSILINDATGLSGRLLFDGSEAILISISKDINSDVASFKKAFRIHKQSNRRNTNQNSESYVLHFVSDELMYSDQQRVNQSYDSTYSGIIGKILLDYLKVPNNNWGLHEPTSGIRKIVIPNLRPLEAIDWCTKRSLDSSNSPNYTFYQNILGYNFASLSTLLTKEEVIRIRLEPKNVKSRNSIDEMVSARSYEVVLQNDSIDKTRNGVNAGRFIGFDPMTRSFASRNIGYGDHYNSMKHGNDTPNFTSIKNRVGQKNDEAFDSKKVLSLFGSARKYSNYIKQNDPASRSKDESYENYIFQRRAIFENLMAKRLKLVMPGNFQLTSGFNVDITAPNYAKKEKGDSNIDPSVNGKYIIIATRHIIGYNKHETIIEVASSSTNNYFIPESNPQQNELLLNY